MIGQNWQVQSKIISPCNYGEGSAVISDESINEIENRRVDGARKIFMFVSNFRKSISTLCVIDYVQFPHATFSLPRPHRVDEPILLGFSFLDLINSCTILLT